MANFIFLLLAKGDVVGPGYTALPAAKKQAMIWDNILLDNSSNSRPSITGIFTQSMCPSLEAPGDEMPTDRKGTTRQKYIHSVGSVGMVEFVSSESRYTGLFQGARFGIVRISLAAEPKADVLNTIPGMGLKFLRDGVKSASLVAMYKLEGQKSWNVFANRWSNHIGPPPGSNPLVAKFATATPNIQQVGLSDWSRYGEDGVLVADSDMVYPYKLVFK